ncbi:MAG TPA: DUF2089 domain-containing protein [Oscillatoriaceae cyanobacterium]
MPVQPPASHLVITQCPVCEGAMHVTRLACGECGSALEGHFSFGWLEGLSREQIRFIQTFLKCRGKIKDVEQELGISYPTVVSRLNEVVRAMGLEAASGEETAIAVQRREVLDELAAGTISATEAAERIRSLSAG